MKFNKIIAALSATMLTATLSATSIPAFAATYEGIEKQEFVDSFADSSTQSVAKYYMDNGLSLEEMQDLMATYEEGLVLLKDEGAIYSTTSSGSTSVTIGNGINYYNGTRMASTSHRATIVTSTPNVEASINFIVGLNSQIVYDVETKPYTIKWNYVDNASITFNVPAAKNKILITGYIPSLDAEDPTVPDIILTFPFTAGTATTEAGLYSGFTFYSNHTSFSNGDGTYYLHTYALGDLNHDGIVNSADVTLASQFLTHQITSISFKFNDVTSEIATQIFTLCLDADESGMIDVSDLVTIRQLAN